jgi:hypothetical protein
MAKYYMGVRAGWKRFLEETLHNSVAGALESAYAKEI